MISKDMLQRVVDKIQTSGETFTLAQMHDPDPARRPNFSQLLGVTRVAPEEPPKKEEGSQASSPAESGTNQAAAEK